MKAMDITVPLCVVLWCNKKGGLDDQYCSPGFPDVTVLLRSASPDSQNASRCDAHFLAMHLSNRCWC